MSESGGAPNLCPFARDGGLCGAAVCYSSQRCGCRDEQGNPRYSWRVNPKDRRPSSGLHRRMKRRREKAQRKGIRASR